MDFLSCLFNCKIQMRKIGGLISFMKNLTLDTENIPFCANILGFCYERVPKVRKTSINHYL